MYGQAITLQGTHFAILFCLHRKLEIKKRLRRKNLNVMECSDVAFSCLIASLCPFSLLYEKEMELLRLSKPVQLTPHSVFGCPFHEIIAILFFVSCFDDFGIGFVVAKSRALS